MEKRLYRSRTNRIIWGVCGGLAEYFNLDPAIIRVIFVLLTFAGGVGIIAYIILAIIAPLPGSETKAPRDIVKDNVQDIKATTEQLGKELQSSLSKKDGTTTTEERFQPAFWLGGLLVILGLWFLLSNIFGHFFSFRWDLFWPVILIIIGLLIVAFRRK